MDRQVIGGQSKQTVKGREREREGDRHGAIMKMNANRGEGSQGRSAGKGLENDTFKSDRGPNW